MKTIRALLGMTAMMMSMTATASAGYVNVLEGSRDDSRLTVQAIGDGFQITGTSGMDMIMVAEDLGTHLVLDLSTNVLFELVGDGPIAIDLGADRDWLDVSKALVAVEIAEDARDRVTLPPTPEAACELALADAD